MKVRTFSSHNGVRFILTFDVPGFVLFFFFYLVMPGGALFYLAVRVSDNLLTNLNSGISLVDLFLFKFK